VSQRKTDNGLVIVEEDSQWAVGAVSRRSWRRGKVRQPQPSQAVSEGLRKASRRKASKRARKARKKNRR
jgi:hypothetical protein